MLSCIYSSSSSCARWSPPTWVVVFFIFLRIINRCQGFRLVLVEFESSYSCCLFKLEPTATFFKKLSSNPQKKSSEQAHPITSPLLQIFSLRGRDFTGLSLTPVKTIPYLSKYYSNLTIFLHYQNLVVFFVFLHKIAIEQRHPTVC